MGRKRKCIQHTPLTTCTETVQSRKGQIYCANCTTKGKPTKIQLCEYCGSYHSTHNFGRESANCSLLKAVPGAKNGEKGSTGSATKPNQTIATLTLRQRNKRRKLSSNAKIKPSPLSPYTAALRYVGDDDLSSGSSGEENYAASIQNSPKADRATLLKKRALAAAAAAAAKDGPHKHNSSTGVGSLSIFRPTVERSSTFERADLELNLLKQSGQLQQPAGTSLALTGSSSTSCISKATSSTIEKTLSNAAAVPLSPPVVQRPSSSPFEEGDVACLLLALNPPVKDTNVGGESTALSSSTTTTTKSTITAANTSEKGDDHNPSILVAFDDSPTKPPALTSLLSSENKDDKSIFSSPPFDLVRTNIVVQPMSFRAAAGAAAKAVAGFVATENKLGDSKAATSSPRRPVTEEPPARKGRIESLSQKSPPSSFPPSSPQPPPRMMTGLNFGNDSGDGLHAFRRFKGEASVFC